MSQVKRTVLTGAAIDVLCDDVLESDRWIDKCYTETYLSSPDSTDRVIAARVANYEADLLHRWEVQEALNRNADLNGDGA